LILFSNDLAAPLTKERAETEVRAYLERMLTQEHLSQMQALELSVPDEAMALRWQQDRPELDQTVFQSIAVRVFLFTPPLVSLRIYFVRTELIRGDQSRETRFFPMGAENRISDFFWVDEKPASVWWLSR
jgi:hypothetical protein